MKTQSRPRSKGMTRRGGVAEQKLGKRGILTVRTKEKIFLWLNFLQKEGNKVDTQKQKQNLKENRGRCLEETTISEVSYRTYGKNRGDPHNWTTQPTQYTPGHKTREHHHPEDGTRQLRGPRVGRGVKDDSTVKTSPPQ